MITTVDLPIKRELLYDTTGNVRKGDLFYEHKYSTTNALFTMWEWDRVVGTKNLLSLKRVFLEIADPTEYEFAIKVFGSWQTWAKISDSPVLKPMFDEWRTELSIKLRSQGIRRLIEEAGKKNGPSATASARWLADKGFTEKQRGRPSKKEVAERAKENERLTKDVRSDMKRLGLSVVKE